jgi:hypothetical protein
MFCAGEPEFSRTTGDVNGLTATLAVTCTTGFLAAGLAAG